MKLARESLRQFAGRVSNANPHLIPAGAAQRQDNITCVVPGQLTVRKGHRPIVFANAQSGTASADVIAMHLLPRPEAQWIVYQTSDGAIRTGRGAA